MPASWVAHGQMDQSDRMQMRKPEDLEASYVHRQIAWQHVGGRSEEGCEVGESWRGDHRVQHRAGHAVRDTGVVAAEK